MWVSHIRQPALAEEPISQVLARTAVDLGPKLDGYEYVAERPVLMLEPNDQVDEVRIALEARPPKANGECFWGTHVARRITDGWELWLVIFGD